MRSLSQFLLAGSVALIFAGCSGTPTNEVKKSEAPPAAPAGDGVIAGRILFTGAKPVMKPLTAMDANPQCLTQHGGKPPLAEEVVVNADGTLKNVFVYVKAGLPEKQWPVPATRAKLDQVKCIYTPHVLGLMAGQELEITNSDPVNHNIHPIPMENREWNESQPPQGDAKVKTFPKPELKIPFKCNVHPWMRAYVNVVSNPFFAVTGDDGKFEIKGLPPGEYTIEAVHEKYEPQEIKVKVDSKIPVEAVFTFKG